VSAETAGSASALLQEIILRHYRAPVRKQVITAPTATVEKQNPLCGDTLALAIRVRGYVIEDAGFQAQACSITQATASMVMARIVGQSPDEARALADTIEALAEDAAPSALTLGDLEAVRSVARFPARKACVRLVTGALREALAR
jgi:nitrogen fixation protein NifU and related proteins